MVRQKGLDRASHLQASARTRPPRPQQARGPVSRPPGGSDLPPRQKHCWSQSRPPSPPGPIPGSSPPITLVPLGDRPGRHGERAPAVSRQQSRPLTAVTTSTSGAKAVERVVGGAVAGEEPEAAAAILGAAGMTQLVEAAFRVLCKVAAASGQSGEGGMEMPSPS